MENISSIVCLEPTFFYRSGRQRPHRWQNRSGQIRFLVNWNVILIEQAETSDKNCSTFLMRKMSNFLWYAMNILKTNIRHYQGKNKDLELNDNLNLNWTVNIMNCSLCPLRRTGENPRQVRDAATLTSATAPRWFWSLARRTNGPVTVHQRVCGYAMHSDIHGTGAMLDARWQYRRYCSIVHTGWPGWRRLIAWMPKVGWTDVTDRSDTARGWDLDYDAKPKCVIRRWLWR